MKRTARKASPSRTPLIVGILFMAVGGLFACAGVGLALQVRNLVEHGERTGGSVLRIERSSTSYYPVVAFQDRRGRRFEVRSPDSSRSLAPGDEVTVVYDPAEPLSGRIVEAASYTGGLALGLFGSVFFLIGAAVTFLRKRFDENGEMAFGSKGTAA